MSVWLHRAFAVGYRLSSVVVHRLLTVVAPLAVEHRLWAHGLQPEGSLVVAQGLQSAAQ